MWVLVAFDLPVITPKERRIASSFREYLKTLGFIMLQKSIYSYYACTKERSDSISENIKKHIPDNGHVCVLFLTDRMFSMTRHYYGRLKVEMRQPELFDNLL
ncbi:MAG: CRISPR-associated endonuclease Cas2 [Elusimicrobiota bacterium]|jgi:CRISPR-associated protein Cas2|nr:CRISPR-associated endonuclease Cas2 [Elusimicrobiota bacterium]